MKVVHLSTYDTKGGAALSAYRLHRGLREIGCDTSMLVRFRSSQDPSVKEYTPPMNLTARLRRRLRRRSIVKSAQPYTQTKPAGYELFSEDRTPFGSTVLEQVPACDVINLHWVAAFIDYEGFFEAASKQASIVWTLHDMNPVTGGCHYDMDCGRFSSHCGHCPQLGSQTGHDLAAQVWERKKHVFERISPQRCCVVTPSRWLGQVVSQSPVLSRFRVETIPYGISLDDFAPRDRATAREVIGIPQKAKVILFLAEMVDNRRKGFGLLAEALRGCHDAIPNVWLLSVGNNAPKLSGGLSGSHLNYVGNDRFLSLAYSAADVFVIPSLQDNLPNTVMEAMACGTAVIGFDVGGIRDMVRHGQTGFLVRPGDGEGLRSSIVTLLQNGDLSRSMGEQGRRIALAEYPLQRQAERYAQLYKELLA